MDQQRFDDLTRSISAAVSRRQVLKALAGGLMGAVGGARQPSDAAVAAARQTSVPASPNFPLLAALPTDRGLGRYALEFTPAAPPTWFRTVDALGFLSTGVQALVRPNFRGAYAATISAAKSGAPDEARRKITSLFYDLGTADAATQAYTSYVARTFAEARRAGADLVTVDAPPTVGETSYFIGCNGGCDPFAPLTDGGTGTRTRTKQPDSGLGIIARRGRFLVDLRIHDFDGKTVTVQDAAPVARLIDTKLRALVLPVATGGDAASGVRALLGFGRFASAKQQGQNAAQPSAVEQTLASANTFATFGVRGITPPAAIRQWLAVDDGTLVPYVGQTPAELAERAAEVPNVRFAVQAEQPLALTAPYRGAYDLVLSSTQYTLASADALRAFQTSARSRREQGQPGIQLTDAGRTDAKQGFTYEVAQGDGGTRSGYELHSVVGAGDLHAALRVNIAAVPRDLQQPPVPADALRQDCGPWAAEITEVLANCLRSPETCPDTAPLPVLQAVAVPADSCPAGAALCAGVCVDTSADGANCGACGQTCGAGERCVGGVCEAPPLCPGVETRCPDGICSNLATDSANCGECGLACGDGETCAEGVCGGQPLPCAEITCPAGYILTDACDCVCPDGLIDCDGACADTASDPNHCGACGNVCAEGESCDGGSCVAVGCPEGEIECDGACVEPTTDSLNCGGCGLICADGVCEGGVCVGGEPECGALTPCGFECIDPSTDPFNCGACGVVCAADEICEAGVCTFVCTCPDGATCCGDLCVDLLSDPANCGTCGGFCESAICAAGVCEAPGCPDGLSACGDQCVDLNADAANCGDCGIACESERCAGGVCAPVDCGDGLTDCGGFCVDTFSDPAHCGGCGIGCESGVCDGGGCAAVPPVGCDSIDCSGTCCGDLCCADGCCEGGCCDGGAYSSLA